MKNSIEALNHHFIIQLFRAAISFYSCHNRRPKEGEVLLLDAVLKEVGGNLLQVKPLVALWYYACQLTFNPLDLHLAEELKYALLQHTGTIPPFDGYTFIVILNNGLVQRLGHSRQKYLQERYDLYQIEIAEGWLAADGVIGNAIFNNIIIASLALGKIADAEVFLEKYKENLLPGIREEIILYNRARIAFAKNGFQESLRLAQRVNYLNHSIALGIKRIQMMCFIELNDLAQAQHIWNSMNMYIFRLEDAGKSLKVRNSQFLKVTKLLMKEGWVKKKEKYRDQIIEIIAASPLMPEVEWIESRLKNL